MSFVNNLGSFLNDSTIQRNVIADNIANYNTPNFKQSNVSFDQLFQSSQKNISLTPGNAVSLSGRDLQTNGPTITTDTTTQVRADGNNVDLNQQMTDMIKNQFLYSFGVQALNEHFTMEKSAITGQ